MQPRDVLTSRCLAAALLLPLLLSGCQTGPSNFELAPGAVARMRPLGSAAQATVNSVNRRQGAVFNLTLQNVVGGPYRLALHQVGNCSSPNGFSAGDAWAPPGAKVPPGELFPVFYVNMQGQTEAGFYVPGVSVDGPDSLLGRTIILHQGTVVSEATPGQPNNRVACGTFELPSSKLF